VDATLTSPFGATSDVLRFFAAGGVDGGASATVAFFLLRAMIAKHKKRLEKVVPILKKRLIDGGERRMELS
jgi:hypothetical protein